MSEISIVGWIHTISGTLALVLAARIIYKDKFISAFNFLGSKLSTFNCNICWYFAVYF